MEVLASVTGISKEGVDTRMLKANVLAIIISAFVALTIFLVYYLIKDYLECITLAVLSSMALRPIKAWSLLQLQSMATSAQYFPRLGRSWLATAVSAMWRLFRGRAETQAEKGNEKSKGPDAFWISIIAFLLYVCAVKLKPRTLFVILLTFLLADMTIRLVLDLFSMCIRLSGWSDQTNAHRAEACSSLISLLVLFSALFSTFALGLVLAIPTGLEIKDQGANIIAKVQGLGFNLTAESITLTITNYVEQAGGLKAWLGAEETIGLLANDTNSQILEYVSRVEELPMVGEQLKAGLKWLDERLSALGLPSHQVIDFVVDNINEISQYGLQAGGLVWSLFLSSATSIFSSFIDFVYCACLYLSLVFFLMTRESSVLFTVISIIPIGEEMKRKIEADLSANVVQIFATIIKVSIAYSLSTYMLFDSLDLPLKHTAAMLSGLVGFIQLLDPWMVTLPWAVSLLLSGMYTRAAVVAGVEYFVLGYFYKDIYSQTVTGLNVTILTLASVFGLSNFGVLGVIYGPLIAGLIDVFINSMKGVKS